ncbi:MAG TPA: hypothetical protein VFR67_16735 [Pilimelia sp.]|nr:hypothetical protein [Pilimelia sp.]
MAQWAVVIPADRFEAERLFHHDTLELDDPHKPRPGPIPGDEVLVVADAPVPAVVAVGRVAGEITGGPGSGTLTVAYTRRCFDDPQPAGGLILRGSVTPLDPAAFRALAERVAPTPDSRTWLVSVDLPIEATTAAEAVRRFWSYVMELGPRELPAFVSPSDDELAMQAYVLGEQANLDPEEDDDEQ